MTNQRVSKMSSVLSKGASPVSLKQARPVRLKGVSTKELTDYLAKSMDTARFKDYCPNGLQIEGKPRIQKLAFAVTASQNAIAMAATWGADAMLVHHGLFWRGDDARIVGIQKRRIQALFDSDINLLAYHLPLDAHKEWGNNAALGDQLQFKKSQAISADGLIWASTLTAPLSAKTLASRLQKHLGRTPLLVGNLDRTIKTVAWCTGGAQGYLDQAIALGADAYISGEISEQTTHLARESGVIFAAAGHHATERYGVQALAKHLAGQFELDCRFFDDDNPA